MNLEKFNFKLLDYIPFLEKFKFFFLTILDSSRIPFLLALILLLIMRFAIEDKPEGSSTCIRK